MCRVNFFNCIRYFPTFCVDCSSLISSTFQPYTGDGVLSDIVHKHLYNFWVGVPYPDQPLMGVPFEVLLGLGMYERGSYHSPPFTPGWQRFWPSHRQAQVVSRSQYEIAEEIQIFIVIGTQLQVCYQVSMCDWVL